MSADRRGQSFAGGVYDVLLRCYPQDFRARFGRETSAIFEDRRAAAKSRGRVAGAWFTLWALADVVASGLAERFFPRGLSPAANRWRGAMTWDGIRGDVRLAFRVLWRTPGHTTLAVAALALGIGTCTAMFSVIDHVLLRPLPYAHADQLVRVRGGQSYPDLQDWLEEARQFQGFGAFRAQSYDRATPDGTVRLTGALVTGTLFNVLGVRPQLGRLIEASDDRPGGEHVAVLSDGFWRRAFGARSDVLGRTLSLIDGNYKIVGILPPDFELWLTPADVIAPANAESTEFTFRGVHSLAAVGRLRDDTTFEAAQAEMDAIATRLAERYPQQNRDRRFVLQPLQASLVARVQPTLLILFGAVAIVWLIACVNVANLQLGRALGRRVEMATRRAIGATRLQLFRQLLIEHLVLALIAGLAGIVAAHWLTGIVAAASLEDIPRFNQVGVDGRIIAFAMLTSLVTAVLFGVVPAIVATSRNLGAAAGHGARVRRGRARLTTAVLVVEIAATVVLMIGGGLLLNSYAKLMRVNPGFSPEQLLTFNLTLRPLPRTPRPPNETEADAARRSADLIRARSDYYDRVTQSLRSLPGVTAVAVSTDLPIAEGSQPHNLTFEGQQVAPGAEPSVYYRGVNPGFFAAFGMPLLRGREFEGTDTWGRPLVIVINETLARQHFAGEEPIGRRVRWTSGGSNDWMTIVGVATDVKGLGLDTDEVPAVYGPFMQDGAVWRRSMDFAVRTSGDPASLGADIRRAVASVDPTIPVMRLQTMEQLIARSVTERRFVLLLLAMFAIVALALAGIGLYGTIAYAVRARTPELGVRLALGATPKEAVQLVLRQALWCIAFGVVIGVGGARVGVGAIDALLFQIGPTDAATYGVAVAFVTLVALVAALVPAARAARIDPLIVLKRTSE